jgi:hypothetical protein
MNQEVAQKRVLGTRDGALAAVLALPAIDR